MTEPAYLEATRLAYNTVAADYAEVLRTALAEMPFDRAMLGTFAELVRTDGGGQVGDLGCGPGRVTAYLHSLGVDAFGVDLSPEMVAVARQWYPDLRFEEGSILDLKLGDGTLGGVVAFYSIIHTPPELLPTAFAEFHRVLAPGGHLLLAFQVGAEIRHIENAYGHDISLDAYRLSPEDIASRLSAAGFLPNAHLIREPSGPHEKTKQAYLLVRKPA